MQVSYEAFDYSHLIHGSYGMITIGRSWQAGSEYRYGFSGMEMDNEEYGIGNSYDFGARIYDARLGKWLSVDPINNKVEQGSKYKYVSNSPISRIDPDGKTDYDVKYTIETDDKGTVIKVTAYVTIIYQVLDISSGTFPIDDSYDLTGPLPDYKVKLNFEGIEVNVNIDINYEFINNVDQIDDTKNVLLIVDQLTNNNDEGTSGQAYWGDQAMIIPYSSKTNLSVILHEMGHNIGLIFLNNREGVNHSDDPSHLMYKTDNGATKTNPEDFYWVFKYLTRKKESGSEHVTDSGGSDAKANAKKLFKNGAYKFNKEKAQKVGISN